MTRALMDRQHARKCRQYKQRAILGKNQKNSRVKIH